MIAETIRRSKFFVTKFTLKRHVFGINRHVSTMITRNTHLSQNVCVIASVFLTEKIEKDNKKLT